MTGPDRRLTLRVDVDTHTGLRDGVPILLDLLERHRARASFFVTMGPDHSGRAITRVFTRPGFARKMARTGPLRTYGLYTVLSGTLLPARPVGAGFPHLLRLIESFGHECGVHGWDHVLWHDRLDRLSPAEVQAEIDRAVGAFQDATGHPPGGTAAPAWRATERSLEIQDRLPFEYASDTRGSTPFAPRAPGGSRRLLQIPTTLPTVDELLGAPGMSRGGLVDRIATALRPGELNVFTLHTEIEGRHHASVLEALLRRWREEGWEFETLAEAARRIRQAPRLAVCDLLRGSVEGRAGWVSTQGPAEETAHQAPAWAGHPGSPSAPLSP